MVPDDPDQKIDAWLDEALAGYSAAEPATGLEQRVLENLRGQRRGLPGRWRKAWAPALAAAAALIVVMLVVVRSRGSLVESTVPPESAGTSVPSKTTEPAEVRQPETAVSESDAGKPNLPESSETSGTPGPGTTVSGLTSPETAGPAKAAKRITSAAGTASKAASIPHQGSVFPLPTPLSEQERLALAAARSGLLPSPLPKIPPGEEPLPQVVIDEITIKPLQAIKPISEEGA